MKLTDLPISSQIIARWRDRAFKPFTANALQTPLASRRLFLLQFFKLFFMGLVVLIPLGSYAQEEQDSWYQIEYIILQHNDSDPYELRYEDVSFSLETPPAYWYYLPIALATPNSPLSPFQLSEIPLDDASLGNALARIKKDPRTGLLQFRAWKQKINDGDPSLPLKIQEDLGGNSILEGTLTIRRERYLHADLDIFLYDRYAFRPAQWAAIALSTFSGMESLLSFLVPLSNNSNESLNDGAFDPVLDTPKSSEGEALVSAQDSVKSNTSFELSHLPLNVVHFQDTRRIKDGEVHYLDHPLLGLIVTIKRVDDPFSFSEESRFE